MFTAKGSEGLSDPEVFQYEINSSTLDKSGNPIYISQNKKKANGFVVDQNKFSFFANVSTLINEINFFTTYEEKEKVTYLSYQFADKNNIPLANPVRIAKKKGFCPILF
jgi:hypothetical protein